MRDYLKNKKFRILCKHSGALLLGLVFLSIVIIKGTNALLSKFNEIPIHIVFVGIRDRMLCQQIMDWIQEERGSSKFLFFHSDAFYSRLRCRFNMVEKVSIVKLAAEGIKIEVVGVKPMHNINNDLVLCNNAKLYPARYFSDVSNKLPFLRISNIPENLAISQEEILFLSSIPIGFYEQYEITYESLNKITLKHKSPLFYIIADKDSLSDAKKIKQVGFIFDDMQRRRGCSYSRKQPKKKTELHFDIRFRSRIIVKIIDKFG